jgi:hypothetical protein
MSGKVKLAKDSTQQGMQRWLDEELEKLQEALNVGYNLKVRWIPKDESKLSGEVRGEIIYVYDPDEGKALETLKHELVDYCVSQAIEPYRKITNRLIKMVNEEAYQRKERIVEALTRLIGETGIENR